MLSFFTIVLIAYRMGNAFGVSLIYLGIITFFQSVQFFNNFKNLHYYYLGILMAGKSKEDDDIEDINESFAEVMHFSTYYGKFGTGVTLFIHKVMCFTILVDSFNMHKYHHISLIQPYTLISIMFGVFAIQTIVSLDLVCVTQFVKYFIQRINRFEKPKIDLPDYEPDLQGICGDLLKLAFLN